jgi:hypothetical protein
MMVLRTARARSTTTKQTVTCAVFADMFLKPFAATCCSAFAGYVDILTGLAPKFKFTVGSELLFL